MLITRSGILRECLEEYTRKLARYSKHGACLLPLEGYEKIFDDLNESCKLLRAMVIECVDRELSIPEEASNMPRATVGTIDLAQWQKDLMNQKAEDLPMMTPDEVALRRRYRKAQGFKPAPVVYPGGEEDGPVQD